MSSSYSYKKEQEVVIHVQLNLSKETKKKTEKFKQYDRGSKHPERGFPLPVSTQSFFSPCFYVVLFSP